MKFNLSYYFVLAGLFATTAAVAQGDTASYTDTKYMIADNMLIYQRGNGGWPKQIDKKAIDYNIWLTKKDQSAAKKEAAIAEDATIDNSATTKEARYLLKVYKETGNKAYLSAAENGIRYLYKAQYKNGGWPQFYPDFSKYHGQVTFNDNAMINVLNLLMDLQLGINDMEVVDAQLRKQSQDAVNRGVDVIIMTQLYFNKKPTGWCQQYDQNSLAAVTARAFELPGAASSETVGIIRFLMRIEKPDAGVKKAITSAVEWLESVKISGYRFDNMPTADGKKNKVLIPDATAVTWSRYYDLFTNKPFFCGRDGKKKDNVMDIEDERRNGYAWYGNWAEKLLNKEYPKWLSENGK